MSWNSQDAQCVDDPTAAYKRLGLEAGNRLVSDLANRRLRASSSFVLLAFDELEPAVQQRLATLREDPDFFGILQPVNALLPAKSVSKEAALLFLTLHRAQRIPTLLASIFGDDPCPLLGLLADGVLEVEHGGAFLSGPAALRLFPTASRATPASHPASRLSSGAIACAASYEGLDAAALADKVYAFGRQPCTAEIRRRFARDVDLLAFLTPDRAVAELLSSGWASDSTDESPWLSWSTRRTTPRLGYKLYVSARLEAMPRVFAMAVHALKRSGCVSFKIGRHGEGVCRPDKMVAYFASLEPLRACAGLIEADLLASDIAPASAHGVPFTAPIDGAGFLTWGMDPPDLAHTPEALHLHSWRQWIAARVAVAVLSAKSVTSQLDVILSSVLQRVALDGIDPDTWAPTLSLWREHAANPVDVA